MSFNFIRKNGKNNVSPIVSFKNTFRPSINFDFGGGGRNLFILLILVSCVLILTSPLAAQETEKLTLSPAGSASWSDHLTFQQENPEYGKEPKVVPFIPMPEPREVDASQNPPGPVTLLGII